MIFECYGYETPFEFPPAPIAHPTFVVIFWANASHTNSPEVCEKGKWLDHVGDLYNLGPETPHPRIRVVSQAETDRPLAISIDVWR